MPLALMHSKPPDRDGVVGNQGVLLPANNFKKNGKREFGRENRQNGVLQIRFASILPRTDA
jgi:hypothetical protein